MSNTRVLLSNLVSAHLKRLLKTSWRKCHVEHSIVPLEILGKICPTKNVFMANTWTSAYRLLQDSKCYCVRYYTFLQLAFHTIVSNNWCYKLFYYQEINSKGITSVVSFLLSYGFVNKQLWLLLLSLLLLLLSLLWLPHAHSIHIFQYSSG